MQTLNKAISNEVKYTFEAEKEIISKEYNSGPRTSIRWIAGNEYLYPNPPYFTKIINDALYIRYASCENYPAYTIEKLLTDIQKSTNKNIKKVIIDLRDNQGGDSDLLLPIIDYIKETNLPTYTFSHQEYMIYMKYNLE